MIKKRVLLVTSKFPYSQTEADGGRSTVASIITSLKDFYDLDILFIRSPRDEEREIDGVKNIFFEEIRHKSSNKFERRIYNCDQVASRIIGMAANYDCIIIIHVSKAFRLEMAPREVLNKVILYPMFLSFAYKVSGEDVPETYCELERKCLHEIKWIVCPSEYDKKTIIEQYGMQQTFFVIPRSATNYIMHSHKQNSHGNRLLCIGNIKVRKQPLVLLRIFARIKRNLLNASLTFVGEIQDANLYQECLKYIAENKLEASVSFLRAVNQEQIGKLIENSDINVCTSNFETFGRCIFEGMFGGLPTVVFDKLECVEEFVKNGEGIFLAKDEDDFCAQVLRLLTDDELYNRQSVKAIESTTFISSEAESKALRLAVERVIRG